MEQELESSVVEIPNGVRIANAKLDAMEAKGKALEAKLKALKPTKEMESSFHNAEWRQVEKNG